MDSPRDSTSLLGANAESETETSPTEELATWRTEPLVTRREKWGWYLYDAAGGCFTSIALNGYLPVLVTDMAKIAASRTDDVCFVPIGSIKIRPSAYSSTLVSISVLVQAIVFILSSSLADYGGLRKGMLLTCAWIGGAMVVAVGFVAPYDLYWLVGLILVLSNVFFGWSYVFYNAFLPHLSRWSRKVQNAEPKDRNKAFDEEGNSISTRGAMVGGATSALALGLTIPIAFTVPTTPTPYYDCSSDEPILIETEIDSTFAFRICCALAGAMWMALSLFTFFWVQRRPGPPLPKGSTYIGTSVRDVITTIRHVKKLPQTCLYLFSYFMCSDGYNTIASVGVLFATQELKADAVTLGAMLLLVPFAGFAGAFVWYKVKLWFNLTTKTMLVLVTVSMTVLPCFGMLGFIESSPIGLKNTWELYPFAIWFGFNLGAIESFARTIFSQLTPPGREAEFFGFYELTDKGSSWIGPAMTAILTQAFGSVRYAHIWLYFSFMVSLILLRFVDVQKGAKQAKKFVVHEAFAEPDKKHKQGDPTEAQVVTAGPEVSVEMDTHTPDHGSTSSSGWADE